MAAVAEVADLSNYFVLSDLVSTIGWPLPPRQVTRIREVVGGRGVVSAGGRRRRLVAGVFGTRERGLREFVL